MVDKPNSKAEGLSGPESSGADIEQIKFAVEKFHNQFLQIAPRYEPGAWNPLESIKKGSGSCMAELLYVAGGLMHDSILDEKDISIGFSTKHGQLVENRFGSPRPHYGHTTLFLISNQGTVELDFRANRADETPRLQAFDQSLLDIPEVYYIGTLEDAISIYASGLGQKLILPEDLIKLHQTNFGKYGGHDVKFDEEF